VGPGAADGRRRTQPQPRGEPRSSSGAGAGDGQGRKGRGHGLARARVHSPERPLLPELSMPMAKVHADAAEGVARSSMVTVMARNGTDFGIQVASMPGALVRGPAQPVRGLYFPGFSAQDANPDIGDSAITETRGIGGFAMAGRSGHRAVRGGSAARTRSRRRARWEDHRGAQPVLGDSLAGLRRHAHGRRPPEGGRASAPAGHQHRHRPSRGGESGQVGAGLTIPPFLPPWECFARGPAGVRRTLRRRLRYRAHLDNRS